MSPKTSEQQSSTDKSDSEHQQKPKKLKDSDYSITRGVSYLIGGVLSYYVLPWFLFNTMQTGPVQLPMDFSNDIQAFGIISSLLIFCIGYTPRGSRINAAGILIQIVLTYGYLWAAVNGGVIDVMLGSFTLHFEFGLIMYWMLAIAALNALPYVDLIFRPQVKS